MIGKYHVRGMLNGSYKRATIIIRTDLEIKAFILTPQNRKFAADIQGTISKQNDIMVDFFVKPNHKTSNFGVQTSTYIIEKEPLIKHSKINKNLGYSLSIIKKKD